VESVLNKKRKVTVEKICRKWRFKPEMKEWRGVVSVVSPYRVPIFPFADQGLICRSRVSAFSFTVSRQILVDWCMSPLVGETKNLTKFAIWRSYTMTVVYYSMPSFTLIDASHRPEGWKKTKIRVYFPTILWCGATYINPACIPSKFDKMFI